MPQRYSSDALWCLRYLHTYYREGYLTRCVEYFVTRPHVRLDCHLRGIRSIPIRPPCDRNASEPLQRLEALRAFVPCREHGRRPTSALSFCR